MRVSDITFGVGLGLGHSELWRPFFLTPSRNLPALSSGLYKHPNRSFPSSKPPHLTPSIHPSSLPLDQIRDEESGTSTSRCTWTTAAGDHDGGEAAPRRVRERGGPARREAHGPPPLLLHGDQGGHDDEAGAQCVLGDRASPAPSGAGGAAGGAVAQHAVHRGDVDGDLAAAAAAAVLAAGGVEAGVPEPAATPDLHRQQDRGRARAAAPGGPRRPRHRLAGAERAAVPPRRARPALRGLPARGRPPRRLDARPVRRRRRQGARREAPAPHGRRRAHHARRARRRRRAAVYGQLLVGAVPQVPHRRARGARHRVRRPQGRRGHDRGLQCPRSPRRTVQEALPSGARRRRVAAGEDRQGGRVPPQAGAERHQDRGRVPADAQFQTRRSAHDNGRRHDGPDVGGDDEARQDVRRRRQGVRVWRWRRHRVRERHLPARQDRGRRRGVRAAAAEHGAEGVRAAAAAGGVRAACQPPPGCRQRRRRRHAPPRQPQQHQPPNAAERRACCTATVGSGGDFALVPGHPGHGLPDRRRALRPGQLRLPGIRPMTGRRSPANCRKLYINQTTTTCRYVCLHLHDKVYVCVCV